MSSRDDKTLSPNFHPPLASNWHVLYWHDLKIGIVEPIDIGIAVRRRTTGHFTPLAADEAVRDLRRRAFRGMSCLGKSLLWDFTQGKVWLLAKSLSPVVSKFLRAQLPAPAPAVSGPPPAKAAKLGTRASSNSQRARDITSPYPSTPATC
ncbi:uncharacterized protein CTHT_0067150 [Thermochaetoides thermophila DSM 1495]|uniref:Uncharacterized protein n=1 Tax=Chaetomium thermophilum (strain DSM 1495 / CBS 144.50 / IMI 039719) TaxID=759272 RepID=G0SGQ1_CHATD|nr:hypothetical protein CTHT_0067150 [Thermochaetoides thermophila DSM 1495]EGS17390.1 hypothetical protein CTHT_0067150 [Thermochaetoides thermophila DSM 1495]